LQSLIDGQCHREYTAAVAVCVSGKGEKAGQEPTASGAIPEARKTPSGARPNRRPRSCPLHGQKPGLGYWLLRQMILSAPQGVKTEIGLQPFQDHLRSPCDSPSVGDKELPRLEYPFAGCLLFSIQLLDFVIRALAFFPPKRPASRAEKQRHRAEQQHRCPAFTSAHAEAPPALIVGKCFHRQSMLVQPSPSVSNNPRVATPAFDPCRRWNRRVVHKPSWLP
jgi:hypothetical protein